MLLIQKINSKLNPGNICYHSALKFVISIRYDYEY